MNILKKWWVWVIVVILVLALYFIISPKLSENYIKGEIEEANYCDVAEDCVNAGMKCPFGCYNYVNVNEVERIKDLIGSFPSNCEYMCGYCSNVRCIDNKCVPDCSGCLIDGEICHLPDACEERCCSGVYYECGTYDCPEGAECLIMATYCCGEENS